MIEGLWTVQFGAGNTKGSGVVVFVNGKLFGGDNGFTYSGSYSESGENVTANVDAENFDPSVHSVLGGTGKFTLNLQGKVAGNRIGGEGTSPQRPGARLMVVLEKKSSL